MITFLNATKQFGDNPPAVEDVSFSVNDGEFLFLTGHSGSGKTTLLKLLTKEYTLSEGEIEFDGEPLTKIKNSKLHKHRRKIGVVYQDYRLLPELNVWENIALALEIIGKPQKEIEERVTDLLDLVQLSDKAYFFPAELSGGESQRVGIARALATAPNVLLADEPTGNLDPENTLMIARLFDKIHQLGTTVLFATHDLSVLDFLGHRRLKMEKGRLIEDLPSRPNARKPAATKAAAAPTPAPSAKEPQPVIKHSPEPKLTKHEKPKKFDLKSELMMEPGEDEPALSNIEDEAEKETKSVKKGRFAIHFPSFKRKDKSKESAKSEKAEKSESKSDAKHSKTEKFEKSEEKVEKSKSSKSASVDVKIEEL